MQAVFTLTPGEGKRLIAGAVVALPAVRQARMDGVIILAGGSTNLLIATQLLGLPRPEPKPRVSGLVTGLVPDSAAAEERADFYVLRQGRLCPGQFLAALADLGPGDICIKGANAIDRSGRVGVLASQPGGGVAGVMAERCGRGKATLIVPVGLDKLVPSLAAGESFGGWDNIDAALGPKLFLHALSVEQMLVVTESEALEHLTGVRVTQLAAGGIGGSEGATVIGVEGSQSQVAAALGLVKGVKRGSG